MRNELAWQRSRGRKGRARAMLLRWLALPAQGSQSIRHLRELSLSVGRGGVGPLATGGRSALRRVVATLLLLVHGRAAPFEFRTHARPRECARSTLTIVRPADATRPAVGAAYRASPTGSSHPSVRSSV